MMSSSLRKKILVMVDQAYVKNSPPSVVVVLSLIFQALGPSDDPKIFMA